MYRDLVMQACRRLGRRHRERARLRRALDGVGDAQPVGGFALAIVGVFCTIVLGDVNDVAHEEGRLRSVGCSRKSFSTLAAMPLRQLKPQRP